MEGIDLIREKILNDAKEKAKAILKEASEQCDEIIRKGKLEADNKRKAILQKAEREADEIVMRKVSEEEMKIRGEILRIRLKFIFETIDKAAEALRKMDRNKYAIWIKNRLLEGLNEGDNHVLIISPKDRTLFEDILQQIKSEKGEQNIIIKNGDISDGFIIQSDDMDIIVTFDSILSDMKDTLVSKVSDILFEDGDAVE